MSGSRRKPGLLGPYVEGYRAWLAGRGYTPGTSRNMLKDLGRVGRGLETEQLGVERLDEQQLIVFLGARGVPGQRRFPGLRALRPLLRYLQEAGAVPAARPPVTPLGDLLAGYRSWMIQERGLAAATVLRYENTARRFLQDHAMSSDRFAPELLTGADVNTFLLREAARVSAGSVKGRVAELRSVLTFLYVRQVMPRRLDGAVPPVGGWRLAALPRAVSTANIQLLLDSCDRTTTMGLRDLAMMLLAARLGLRSIEIARLELHDLGWTAGEIVVRGKGRRQDRLPLPTEVGDALAGYLLADDRAPAVDSHVFLTCRAPVQPIRADLVGDVVKRACKRAGQPVVGPHQLRHALAGEMLRRGAGLIAISQVLRHQDLATTALYAKVDLDVLRQVAQPWPGASR